MAAPKGNRNSAKGRDWESALRHELDNFESSSIQRGLALRAIAKNVVQKAVDGDWNAIDEIANRLDGKPAQSIEHTGSVENRHVSELSAQQLAEELARVRSAIDGNAQPETGGRIINSVH